MKRVLIIRLTAMGDVAMTSPIVSAVCRKYPDVQFDMLSEPFFEPFFEKIDNLQFIGTNIRKSGEGIKGLWKLYKSLSKNDYDTVIDLHDVLRTKVVRFLFSFLSRTKVYVIDKGRSEKHALVAGKDKHQLKRTTDRYAEVMAKAGFPIKLGGHFMTKKPLAEGEKKEGEIWVGVSPFAQHQGKVYPLDKMKKTVELLADKGAKVFIFGGGAKEKAVAEDWEKDIVGSQSVIGKGKLEDEMTLMSNLDCMISMDSSAMHICSLFGVRVVSVWGATHRYAGFLGYEQSEDDVVEIELACRPCSIYGNKPCKYGDYRCFDIRPEQIVEKIFSDKMS